MKLERMPWYGRRVFLRYFEHCTLASKNADVENVLILNTPLTVNPSRGAAPAAVVPCYSTRHLQLGWRECPRVEPQTPCATFRCPAPWTKCAKSERVHKPPRSMTPVEKSRSSAVSRRRCAAARHSIEGRRPHIGASLV